jgi:hypothetical protein
MPQAKGASVPLQDRPEFRAFLARRFAHADRLDLSDAGAARECEGCGTPADEQQMFGPHCIVCLAKDFGIEETYRRLSDDLAALVGALASTDPDRRASAVQALADRLHDAASDVRGGHDEGAP